MSTRQFRLRPGAAVLGCRQNIGLFVVMLSVSPWCDMAGLGEIGRVMATCATLVAAPVPVSPGRLVTVMTRYRKLGLSGGLA